MATRGPYQTLSWVIVQSAWVKFQVLLVVKKILLPVRQTQERWVQSLGQEESLEEGMVTHSSILAWRISRAEESGNSPQNRKE